MKYKKQCVDAWINRIMPFCTLTTCRPQGNHAVTKQWFSNSRSNVLTFIQRLVPYWQSQKSAAIYTQAHTEMAVSTLLLSDPFLDSVLRIITPHALKIVRDMLTEMKRTDLMEKKQLQMDPCYLSPPPTSCQRVYSGVWGLPCLHQLREMSDGGCPLTPEHFDLHWLIDRAGVQQSTLSPRQTRVLEPNAVARTRQQRIQQESHRRGEGIHGNRRFPSSFEQVLEPGSIPTSLRDPQPFATTYPDIKFGSAYDHVADGGLDCSTPFVAAYLPPRSWGYSQVPYS